MARAAAAAAAAAAASTAHGTQPQKQQQPCQGASNTGKNKQLNGDEQYRCMLLVIHAPSPVAGADVLLCVIAGSQETGH